MTTITLHHELFGESGDRPPLLLVHDGAGTIDTNWRATIASLGPDSQLIGVELQGHGHTPHAERAYTFDNSAADLAALVRSLDVDVVDVMGFSNGGPTVLAFAHRYPDLVRRIVVASGFTRRDGMVDGFWSGFDHPDIASLPAPLAAAYREINPDPDDLRRMFDLDLALMREFTDVPDDTLAAIEAPVLFVGGDRDVVRPGHTVWMADTVRDGRALVLPAGHGDYLGMSDVDEADPVLTRVCLTVIGRFLAA
ncbi:alpha/beta fold hydrolase [Williamsia sterculiae]|uniref:Pimeloyl-ACP methyl ester carboxylesterase n=1 Tax=Williamsia sterculiae TaxID=1344003 RepID=A0A1N7CKQ5_9NOCA|nr:alpha/beta hydrolase [Williamsia sterculiae]SIR64228.1 Pimeloyl-ACP methyl ester carboxylesterase [Williamsia sterculiae]